MNGIVNDNMKYSGQVKLTIKIGNKFIEKSIHNDGLPLLKKAFAMFLCGGASAEQALTYIPKKLDLRYNNSGAWVSRLIKPVPVTSPNYGEEVVGNETTWYVEYTSVIPYSQLIGGIKSGEVYNIYLMCDSELVDNQDLAYIPVPAEDFLSLSPGVSLIINWKLRLLNNVPQEV